MIKLVRVDHRLLHGQVIFSWTQQMSINHIVIIDDIVSNDAISKMALSLAKPINCGLDIISFSEVKDTFKQIQDKSIMILVKGPEEALRLVEKIDEISEINYGGIAKKKDSKQYGKAIYLTKKELEATQKILTKGIKIYVQQVPTSSVEKVDFS